MLGGRLPFWVNSESVVSNRWLYASYIRQPKWYESMAPVGKLNDWDYYISYPVLLISYSFMIVQPDFFTSGVAYL